MANPSSPNARIYGALAVAFVLAFAGFVAWETWLKPVPPEQVSTASGPVPDCTDVSVLPADHALLGLRDGCVEIAFLPDRAPLHVAQNKALIGRKFYDGLVFHRVIDGFMAQTGDPTGTGAGGSDLPDLKAEFSDEPFVRGVLGMARTGDPDSANSQFFIMLDAAPHLNGQYTAFAKVVAGMEHVDAIKKGDPASNGLVTDPDKIITFRASTK
jgi:peptidylprolyl isomerase